MEPRALANMNGTLVTPMKNNSNNVPATPRDCQTVPNNHMSRRDSTLWMRTPSDCDEDEDLSSKRDHYAESGWDNSMLTPVPKTPAPEAIAKFAMDITPTPVTPTGPFQFNGAHDDDDDEQQQYGAMSPEKDQASSKEQPLQMRTCPPKQRAGPGVHMMGAGVLSPEKDQSVMMRLMAARRKSMQFAPKIASPLSKAWN